jgi:hypothetical protein
MCCMLHIDGKFLESVSRQVNIQAQIAAAAAAAADVLSLIR